MSGIEGKRILVLEDDVLLALDAADALEAGGAIVLGPVHRVSAALALLEKERPDAALLDGLVFASQGPAWREVYVAGQPRPIDDAGRRERFQATMAALWR